MCESVLRRALKLFAVCRVATHGETDFSLVLICLFCFDLYVLCVFPLSVQPAEGECRQSYYGHMKSSRRTARTTVVATRGKHLHFHIVGGPYIETIERCPTPLAGNLATAGAVPVPPIARHLEEGALPNGASARSQPERLPPQGGHGFARLLRRRSMVVLLYY